MGRSTAAGPQPLGLAARPRLGQQQRLRGSAGAPRSQQRGEARDAGTVAMDGSSDGWGRRLLAALFPPDVSTPDAIDEQLCRALGTTSREQLQVSGCGRAVHAAMNRQPRRGRPRRTAAAAAASFLRHAHRATPSSLPLSVPPFRPRRAQELVHAIVLSECVYKVLEMPGERVAETVAAFLSQFPPQLVALRAVQPSLPDLPQT